MRTSRYALKTLLAALVGLGMLCMTAATAFAAPALPAHAKVWKSDPAIGSTIAQAPSKVTVFALEDINPDPAQSYLQVYGPSADATDTLISQGKSQVSLSDPKQMSVNITPNSGHANGVYVVFWRTVSADDGDAVSGTFSFTVNPNGAGTTPPASQNNAGAQPGTGNNASTGTPLWALIVAAIVALLVGLGAGLGFGRRRKPATIGAMRASIARDQEEETSKRS